MYEFDLIYSEDLGLRDFSDRKVHCCFNIYKRPKSNKLNKKPNFKLSDVEVIESRQGKNKVHTYDLKINAWGQGSFGKVLSKDEEFAKVFYIIVHNEKYKDEVVQLISTAKWREIYKMTSVPNLLQWQVYKYIKENVDGIQ